MLLKRYDEKCDLWSIGVIAFILLAGYPPFVGKDEETIFDKIKRGDYSVTTPEWKNVSKEAKVLVQRLLTVNPDNRYTAR